MAILWTIEYYSIWGALNFFAREPVGPAVVCRLLCVGMGPILHVSVKDFRCRCQTQFAASKGGFETDFISIRFRCRFLFAEKPTL